MTVITSLDLRMIAPAAFLFAVGVNFGISSAFAAQGLSILSGGAAKSGLTEAISLYEAKSGVKVKAEFQPMGRLTKSLSEGAKPDLVVVTSDVLTEISEKGEVIPGTAVEVGRVSIGVAVKEGAPVPDISTPQALKATLLAAKSVVMINPATGTSGKHLAQVFADLGIADEMKAKTTYFDGGYVVEGVGRGEIEIGLHQITEILPVPGVHLVGPLPDELQKVTTYVAIRTPTAANPEAAQRFLDQLKTPDVRAAISAKGYVTAP